MSLIIHQLKTDCRRFRIGLCFYLAVMAAQVCLPRSLSTTGAGYVSQVVLLIVAWLTALILTAAVVQSDPLVETTSFWMTRPTRRTHLFWSKTAFIVLLVALPCFGAESVVWVRRLGFDFNLWLRATAELALYAVFALALVAAASALSKSALKMVTLLISLAGAFGLWMALLSYLHARGVIRMMGHNDFESMNRMTVTWLALGVLSALAWVLQACFGRHRLALSLLFGALLSATPVYYLWPARCLPFRDQNYSASNALLTVLRPDDSLEVQPGSQLLWSHFRVDGMNSNQLAAVQYISGRFTPGHGQPLAIYADNQSEIQRFNNDLGGDYFKIVQSSFPAGTLWFGFVNAAQYYQYHVSPFSSGQSIVVRDLTPGRLDGRLLLDFWEVRKVADLPIETGAMTRDHGHSFSVAQIKPSQQGIELHLTESKPGLLFGPTLNPQEYGSATGHENDRSTVQLCVLYQPAFGEAFVVSRVWFNMNLSTIAAGDMNDFTLNFPYPALRASLTGVSVKDWLKGARLLVFEPFFVGRNSFAFQEDNYLPRFDQPGNANSAHGAAGLAAIAALELPAQPSAADISSYLETIVANLPQSLPSDAIEQIRRKVNAIGLNGLPELLDLANGQFFEYTFARPYLQQRTRDSLPQLRQGLRRHPSLAFLFREKHWESDARDILISILPDHRQLFDSDALTIVAQAKDPATYRELAWHLAHLGYLPDDLLAALKDCPGFDLSAAVAEQWKRVQLGLLQSDSITLAAAEQGLPEALVQAVGVIESPNQQGHGGQFLPRLRKMTEYTGPAEEFRPWLLEHFEELRFDPARRRYALK